MNDDLRQALRVGEREGSRYLLLVPTNAPAGSTGSRLGHAAGTSLEFRDFRDYQPGDDLRWIDWNAYARSDRLTVRVYHEEVAPHVEIVLDGSRSMALPDTAKAAAAAALAALLTAAAANASCTCRTWLAADGVRELGHIHQPPSLWEELDFTSPGTPADAFALMPPPWRPRTIRILISDLLWLGDPMATLRPMAAGAAAVTVIQLLATADIEPPPHGNTTLVDSETGETREMFIDAMIRDEYRDALTRHQQNWDLACRHIGAQRVLLTAEPLLADWDLQALLSNEILGVA